MRIYSWSFFFIRTSLSCRKTALESKHTFSTRSFFSILFFFFMSKQTQSEGHEALSIFDHRSHPLQPGSNRSDCFSSELRAVCFCGVRSEPVFLLLEEAELHIKMLTGDVVRRLPDAVIQVWLISTYLPSIWRKTTLCPCEFEPFLRNEKKNKYFLSFLLRLKKQKQKHTIITKKSPLSSLFSWPVTFSLLLSFPTDKIKCYEKHGWWVDSACF